MRGAEGLQGRWRTWGTIGVFVLLGLIYLLDDRAHRWETLVCMGALALYLAWEKIADIFDDGSRTEAGEARFDTTNSEER